MHGFIPSERFFPYLTEEAEGKGAGGRGNAPSPLLWSGAEHGYEAPPFQGAHLGRSTSSVSASPPCSPLPAPLPLLTWTDIQAMPDKENVVIIQPVGAIEQHGPHLPLIVDAAIGVGVLGKAMEKLDGSIPAYALPNLYYGKSNEHRYFCLSTTKSRGGIDAFYSKLKYQYMRCRTAFRFANVRIMETVIAYLLKIYQAANFY